MTNGHLANGNFLTWQAGVQIHPISTRADVEGDEQPERPKSQIYVA